MKLLKSLQKVGAFAMASVLGVGMALGVAAPANAYETFLSGIKFYNYYDTDEYVSFGSGDIESNMELDIDWDRAYITLTGTVKDAKISGDDIDYSSSKDMYYVNFNGDTEFDIKLYDEGSYDRKYSVSLTDDGYEKDEDDYNDDVDGLYFVKFDGDDFYKKFTKFDGTMEFTVPYDEDELDLTVDADNDYIVEWDGDDDRDNEWTLDLDAGETNRFTLNIYHEDESRSKGEEIDFKIYREDEDEDRPEGALKGLEIQWDGDTYDFMPEFDSSVFDYVVCLPEDADEVRFEADFAANCDTVKINGDYYDDDERSDYIDIDDDENGTTVNIIVKNDDDEYASYKVQVLRGQDNDDDVDLDGLTVKMGTTASNMSITSLSPAFDIDESDYDVAMNGKSAYYSFKADFADSDSRVFVFTDYAVYELEDGKFSSAMKFKDSDKVTMRVYSNSYESYEDYEFDFVERDLDTDYTLESFDLDCDFTFTPVFKDTTYYYTVNVPADVKEIELTAKAKSSKATVMIDNEGTSVGKATETVYVSGASTMVSVNVTSESGTKIYYKLNLVPKEDVKPAAKTKIVVRIGSQTAIVNGKSSALAAAPYISHDRTMVPLRLVSEQLGATVNYTSATKKIDIVFPEKKLTMTVGQTIPAVGAAPEIVNNITFVPISYITGQLGAVCQFDNTTKEVVIAN